MASNTSSSLCLSRGFATSRNRRARRGYFAKAAVVCLVIAGAAGYYFYSSGKKAPVIEDEMFHQASLGNFVHDVVEKGEVESARNVDVMSVVRGYRDLNSFEILWVIEEGKMVEPGDVLVRLDSAALEEEAKLQRLDLSGSVAGLSKAQNELEAAQIAMKEYVDGLFVQEKQELEAEITFAEETLRRAEEYYAYSSRLAAKGFVTSLQLEGDKFAVRKAELERDNAKLKLQVLIEQTKEKKIKELESAIGVAKADLESAKERNSIEQKRLDFFLEQIKNCTITAPASGQVVYANERGNREASEFIVEPGSSVRERQTIIRLPDYSAMQVHVLINESRVALVDAGMKATITLDAFDGVSLAGTVTKVNEYPEPISRFGAQVKRYAAVVTIDGTPRQIKPGLTANVAIHVEKQDNVLMVPVQAVFPYGDDYYCMVRAGEEIEPRKVDVGSNNNRFVVINGGLKQGEFVSLSPRRLVDSVEMPELSPEQLNPQDDANGAPSESGPQKSPGESGPANQGTQLVDKVLQNFDANNDGILSTEELSANGGEQYVSADQNGDGQVQREELIAATSSNEALEEDPVRIAEDQSPQPVGGAQ
ncbi:efflux RND transporter periplasmic adaptor subunit [Bremerella sp. T1]|uniref:HlyD family efflux transporter periplasmic adaptor subunit n=1 Tax=Bremerella sp. TYQ1 TaxID=3119568 RepID=UPI001CCFB1E0|nr:HlyD family efflux transporter periplasmic adaptor subunit [Bremerella volcania]UBM35216.1 HlyD family efflux transporter periplasmic adaptor subunit [Bremerella volcania]